MSNNICGSKIIFWILEIKQDCQDIAFLMGTGGGDKRLLCNSRLSWDNNGHVWERGM